MNKTDFAKVKFNPIVRTNRTKTNMAVTKVKVSAYDAGRANNRVVQSQFLIPAGFVAELGWDKGDKLSISSAMVKGSRVFKIETNINGDWELGQTPNKSSFKIVGSGLFTEATEGYFMEETIDGSTLFLNS